MPAEKKKDFAPSAESHGWVWQVTAARAEELGLTAYEIAKRCGGEPNKETVGRYLLGRSGLGVKHWGRIARVLGLGVVSVEPAEVDQ